MDEQEFNSCLNHYPAYECHQIAEENDNSHKRAELQKNQEVQPFGLPNQITLSTFFQIFTVFIFIFLFVETLVFWQIKRNNTSKINNLNEKHKKEVDKFNQKIDKKELEIHKLKIQNKYSKQEESELQVEARETGYELLLEKNLNDIDALVSQRKNRSKRY